MCVCLHTYVRLACVRVCPPVSDPIEITENSKGECTQESPPPLNRGTKGKWCQTNSVDFSFVSLSYCSHVDTHIQSV